MNPSRILIIAGIVAFILLIPLIAMQFTDQINWDRSDFILAAVLLFGTGAVINLILKTNQPAGYRIVMILVVLAVLFLVWAELAVGVFGTTLAGD